MAVPPYHQAAERPLTLPWKLLHQAVRSLLAALWPYIWAVMYSCQLPQNVLQGCCGFWLVSLNNRLNLNISSSLDDITSLTHFNTVHLHLCNDLIFSNEYAADPLFIPPVENFSGTFISLPVNACQQSRVHRECFHFITDLITDHISSSLSTKGKNTVTPQGVPPCWRYLIQPKHSSSYVEPSIMYCVNGITFSVKGKVRSGSRAFFFFFNCGSDGAPNAQ